MNKARILIGLTTLICTIAATAAPASAWFESNSAKNTGVVVFPASSTFEYNGTAANAIAKCITPGPVTGSKATGFWQIQETKYTEFNGSKQVQPETKKGPHDAITIEKWAECKVTTCRPSAQ